MNDKKVDESRSTNNDTSEKKESTVRYYTPIIATLLASALTFYATYTYNQRQIQLMHIEVLDKYRSYINSKKYEDREYAFFVFEELGYSNLVDRLALSRKDSAAIKALLTSDRSRVTDKLMSLAVSPEQKTIPSSVSTHDVGTSKKGWVYIGHFEDSKWKTRYFDEIATDAKPESLVGKTLTVSEKTGALNVREGMPTIIGSFKSIIEALKAGSKAKILKVEEWSFNSGYIWAEITYGT